ncbi:MAG: hypothetical protein M3Z85_01765 [Acidobacteriota bacterium]|nr:hypothetical protein [Acidobacteriota bacterium]
MWRATFLSGVRPFLLVCLLFTSACGRYGEFTLPPLATAPPVHFNLETQPQPQLARGGPREWDSVDVLNPSVVEHNATYYNFYSGFDGRTWHTGLAISSDGIHWRKQGRVLSPDPATWEGSYIAANGSALFMEGEFWYWYQAGQKATPEIGLARSRDGRNWRKEPRPVLQLGPRGSWDERGLGDPYVLCAGEWLYMYHLGQDRAHRQRIALARSRDGLNWEKLRSNPVLDLPWPGSGAMDENGDGEPAVWQSSGFYWMLFTGRDRNERRTLGLAHSQDGVHWQREKAVFEGRYAWNKLALCDPTVLLQGAPVSSSIRVWFGGGDRASPDENLNGQIGGGVLHR